MFKLIATIRQKSVEYKVEIVAIILPVVHIVRELH